MKIKEILKDIFPEMSDIVVLNEVCFNTNEDISDDFVKAFTKYSSLKNFYAYLEKITSIRIKESFETYSKTISFKDDYYFELVNAVEIWLKTTGSHVYMKKESGISEWWFENDRKQSNFISFKTLEKLNVLQINIQKDMSLNGHI